MIFEEAFVKKFEKNTKGRDFVVGDLHGCLDHFKLLLKKINFDFEKDRMFSVGDLIDRGPDSLGCLKLIEKPWFHAVQGNHEDMMVGTQFVNRLLNIFKNDTGWIEYYGDWAIYLFNKDEFVDLVKRTGELPFFLTVESEQLGVIGLCHAESPKDWTELRMADVNLALWSREKYRWAEGMGKTPKGVDMTVHGHTPVGEKPKHHKGMNAWWIDTGCFATGFLTALQISGSDIEDAPKVHQVYIPIH